MPIKTLHLTNAFHPCSGGVRTTLLALLHAAERHRRFVRLVVPAKRTSIERVGSFGLIYHVRAPRAPFFDSRYRVLLPHRFLIPWAAVYQIVRKERPDLVEISDKYSLCYLAGALRRGLIKGMYRPVLVGTSSERFDDNLKAYVSSSRMAERLGQWYLRRVYAPQFDFHLANSVYTASELVAVLAPGAVDRMRVATHGVDVDLFHPSRRRPAFRRRLIESVGGGSNTTLSLYAGRLAPEKNVTILVDTLSCLMGAARDYRLIVAGDGPLAEPMKREAERRTPGRLLFLGHVREQDALADLYANCDIFLHPNPREPFGIAPLEAMASGLPLVAPRAGGVLSYASAQNAWLTDPSGDAFAAAVDAIMSMEPDARRERLARARETAEANDWKKVTARLFDLYDELYLEYGSTRRLSPGQSFMRGVDPRMIEIVEGQPR